MSKKDTKQGTLNLPPEPDVIMLQEQAIAKELIESAGDLKPLVTELLSLKDSEMFDRLYEYLKLAKLHTRAEVDDIRFRVPREIAILFRVIALGTNTSIENVFIAGLIALCKERATTSGINPDEIVNNLAVMRELLTHISNGIGGISDTVFVNTFANLTSTQKTNLTPEEVMAAADTLQLEFTEKDEEYSDDKGV